MNRITQENKFKTLKDQFVSVNFSRFEEVDFTTLNKRYASLTGVATDAPFDLYKDTSTVSPGELWLNSMVGHYQMGTNGKAFRIAENGATQMLRGTMQQGKADDTQFQNMAVLAQAIATSGLQTAVVTNGTTTVNANDFAGGSLSIYTTPDLGSEYTILGHTPNVTSGNALTVTLDRPLRTAWTTATKVMMKWNPWKNTIISQTTLTSMMVGVSVFECAASTVASGATDAAPGQFTWLQTHGVGTCLAENQTIVKGNILVNGGTTAGAVTIGSSDILATAGIALTSIATGAATHNIPMFITID